MEMGDVDSVIGPSSNHGKAKIVPLVGITSPVTSMDTSVYRELTAFDAKSFLAVGKALIAEGDRLIKAADAASQAFQLNKFQETNIDEDEDDSKEEEGAGVKNKADVKAPEVNSQALAAQLRFLADVIMRTRTWEDFESTRQEEQQIWRGLE
jgi:hypothetical protein